ncbi:hypothetical protein D3Y59_17485 [Hymenobacter oligotrophus]|uniref:Uncharacterized protein n=1 Tax=Hymenobacter oligotrophus TaxID=2319843 RepID=A0A3B7R3V0_9BACT|nr:hypothetical protein D3Y59_17485 [Hymenobacter oligotrophus]
MRAHKNKQVFYFSRDNDPRHFDEKQKKMVDIVIDDEWQDIVFFEVPVGKPHFRYVDKQLLSAKLIDGTSCFCAAEDMITANIRKGVLEGWRLNDTTWQIRIDASYRKSDQDSTWTVKIKVNQRFSVAKPDTSIWHYRCKEDR